MSRHVYSNAETVRDALFCLFPKYINSTQFSTLEVIVDKFGNIECRHVLQVYTQLFQEVEVEQFSGQKRWRVTVADNKAATPQNPYTIQEAITQVSQVGTVFAHQDPGDGVYWNNDDRTPRCDDTTSHCAIQALYTGIVEKCHAYNSFLYTLLLN